MRVNGQAHTLNVMSRRLTNGLLAALLLSMLGLLAYTTMPKAGAACTTQYVHAAVQTAADAVKTTADTVRRQPMRNPFASSSSSSGSGSNSTLQGLLSGLLEPEQVTPAFLDSAVKGGVTRRGIRQLVQLQQHSFCLAGHHTQPVPGSVGVPFGNVTLFVYGSGDIVSDSLKGSAHGWESAEIQEWLWAIRQWKPPATPVNGSTATVGDRPRPLTVDIGANLDWFSLNAAAAGARVAAFEAMGSNIALIRRSLCASPWLAERIALYPTGLGEKAETCYIISGTGNRGDGFVTCDKQKAYNTPGYEVRGEISIRLLDTLLQEEVQVLKIDVEGYEQKVLTGGTNLLTKHKVHYIMAECNTGIIGEERGKKFIQFLHAQGYEVSPTSFKGPFWDASQIPTAGCSNINLYARRRP